MCIRDSFSTSSPALLVPASMSTAEPPERISMESACPTSIKCTSAEASSETGKQAQVKSSRNNINAADKSFFMASS